MPEPVSASALPAKVEFRSVSKQFGPIQAVSDVSFSGRAGTVHAVTGENGAGKSTLMKMLAGVLVSDAGEILLDGRPVSFAGTAAAREEGVATVFQELTLLPNLTIAENMFLGREPRWFGMVDRRAMRERAREALTRIGIDMDPDVTCGDLALSEQHIIEIAKASVADSSIVIYDEPTAALDAPGAEKLFWLIEEQKRAGKLIFYISHRLDEIFRLCDTTTVLKDGSHVVTLPTAELTRDRLVSLMVGRELAQMYPPRAAKLEEVSEALVVEALVTESGRHGVSFAVRRGEIVGLAGIEGQGQRGMIRAIAGLSPAVSGTATKAEREGVRRRIGSSIVATARSGVGFIPEDRKSEGLFLTLSIAQNMSLGMFRKASMLAAAVVDRGRIAALMKDMRVRARNAGQSVSSLSGGNQQKVMFGRWFSADVDLLLIEEPTRGVDVGAKAEIYRLLREFTDKGGAILMTSSELTEHLGLCDRILVVRDGAIVAEMAGSEATEESVMSHALMGVAGERASA